MRVMIVANPFIPEIHLFHSREKFRGFCEREFGECEDLGSAGQTLYADGLAVVLIEPPDGADLASLFALIAHESYHVACMHLAYLGVTDRDEEVMAYCVQVISGSLCVAHMDWSEKRSRSGVY